jgi:hypothetical protein
MTDTKKSFPHTPTGAVIDPTQEEASDPAKRVAEHLSRQPSDLIDIHRLMRRFRASAEDVQRALEQLSLLSQEDEADSE